jgi:cytochrome c553
MRLPLFCFLSFALPAQAQSLDNLLSNLNSKLNTPEHYEEAVAKGKERAFVCKFCHGEDGNSKKDFIPNLAEQNPAYLLKQFELFASNLRKDKTMSQLAANLSEEDRINIALFYSSQKIRPQPAFHSELVEKGRQIFRDKCIACHGEDGYGKAEIPHIASQPAKYLGNTLTDYINGANRRPDSAMLGVTENMNQDDVLALVAFISAMP